MKIFYSQRFGKDLVSFPAGIKRIYKKQENIFLVNWKDTRLHTKGVVGASLFSFRVTRNYRVLFRFISNDSVLFAAIGHRKDVYD